VALAGEHLPRAAEIHPDARLVGFTLVVSVAAAFVFGLLPSLRWSRTAGVTALREGGRAVGGGERERLRGALVVAETALAVLLLVGAGLLTRGLWRLTHVDPGFRPESVLSLGVTFPADLPGGPDELSTRRDAVLARLRALPGVEAVGGSKTLPLHGQGEPYGFSVPGNPTREITPAGGGFIVTPGYFRALGVPVLHGREYGPEDRRDAPLTLIVNASLAKQLWGTSDAVGKTVLWRERPLTIVGVVGDVRTAGLGQPAPPAMYIGTHLAARASLKLFVRTTGDPAAMADAVRAAIHEVEPDLPIADMAPLDRLVAGTLVQPRLFATLLLLFSGLALVLTLVGLYGVVSFAVAQRTREIAVRMALGAPRSQVLGMVLGRVAALSGVGLGLGLAASFVFGRVLAGQLFGVSARDPATFATVAGLLALAALAAGYLPARRAVRVAPASSLRGE
jgi:predicted permease